ANPIAPNPVVDGNNTAERQRINFTGPPTGGTFQLQFGTITSGNITYSSNANSLQTSIQTQLNSLFGTNNARAIVITPSTVDIVFGNALAGVNMDQMGVANINLTGGLQVTGNASVGSNSVTNLSSTSGLTNGMFVSGVGIPAGTTITAVGPGNAITLSNAATQTGTGVTLTINNVTTAPVNDGSDSAVQQITLSGAISSTTTGTFQIAYGTAGVLTQTVTFSANPTTMANNIQAALDALMGTVNTKVVPLTTTLDPNTSSIVGTTYNVY